MPASPSSDVRPFARTEPRGGWRFAQAEAGEVRWKLDRNCSLKPAQLLAAYAGLCAVSLAVAGFWWAQGAHLVLPFAGCELLAVGAAMLAFARHAVDGERLVLAGGLLRVEQTVGPRVLHWQAATEGLRVRQEGAGLVRLAGRQGDCAVGRYLRPEWRPLLAEELRVALAGSA